MRTVRHIVCAAVAILIVATVNEVFSPPPALLFVVAAVVGVFASMVAYRKGE